jgi:hypothetical protein
MADFSKLGAYNCKDAFAREEIEKLKTKLEGGGTQLYKHEFNCFSQEDAEEYTFEVIDDNPEPFQYQLNDEDGNYEFIRRLYNAIKITFYIVNGLFNGEYAHTVCSVDTEDYILYYNHGYDGSVNSTMLDEIVSDDTVTPLGQGAGGGGSIYRHFCTVSLIEMGESGDLCGSANVIIYSTSADNFTGTNCGTEREDIISMIFGYASYVGADGDDCTVFINSFSDDGATCCYYDINGSTFLVGGIEGVTEDTVTEIKLGGGQSSSGGTKMYRHNLQLLLRDPNHGEDIEAWFVIRSMRKTPFDIGGDGTGDQVLCILCNTGELNAFDGQVFSSFNGDRAYIVVGLADDGWIIYAMDFTDSKIYSLDILEITSDQVEEITSVDLYEFNG